MNDEEFPYGVGPVKWVSTDWLEEHLEDEGLMVLDVQPNIHDYIVEHIPGAVYMNEGLLRVPFKWYLGYPRVKIYEGSFTEWSSYPENPTVIGPNPR